ncbi:MAG: AmmeMemoRadiSam system protein B [Methylococcales bacterium]|nr:AmmeMemoRadiSam system protein B [Methylococcales bacterium]
MNRVPAVAGRFYPAQPQLLATVVTEYLQDVQTGNKVPKAIIAPHAGYIYSAPIAASAYARLIPAAKTIRRVVLIGPSHYLWFRGLAVCSAKAYSTPLGDVPLDSEATAAILELPYVNCMDEAHANEHSLEVQLPFLQTVLRNFTLLPIVAGKAAAAEVAAVLEQLWGDEETLVVVSSDLSHYHDYATACGLDKFTSHLIETLQYREITPEMACGKVGICGLLNLLEQKNAQIKTIDLRNSGDTAGDKRKVVGYGAYVVD